MWWPIHCFRLLISHFLFHHSVNYITMKWKFFLFFQPGKRFNSFLFWECRYIQKWLEMSWQMLVQLENIITVSACVVFADLFCPGQFQWLRVPLWCIYFSCEAYGPSCISHYIGVCFADSSKHYHYRWRGTWLFFLIYVWYFVDRNGLISFCSLNF